MSEYLIAGIDPGSTIGIALLDLHGRKIGTYSFSGGISEAVKTIEAHGTPSLIACDVTPVPDMVARVASFFSCKLYSPLQNIREEDKRKIASGAGTKNTHERDAYTAAVYAYRASANRLRQIEAIEELGQDDREKLKHLLLKGYKLRDAFLSLHVPVSINETQSFQPKTNTPTHEQKLSSDEINEIRERISALARENANLRLSVANLENEKRSLLDQIHLLENGVRERISKDAQVRQLRFQVKNYSEKLAQKGQFWQKKKPHLKSLQNAMPNIKQKSPPNAKYNARQKTTEPQAQGQNTKGAVSICNERGELQIQLNRLVEPKLDLEKLIEAYRKERNK